MRLQKNLMGVLPHASAQTIVTYMGKAQSTEEHLRSGFIGLYESGARAPHIGKAPTVKTAQEIVELADGEMTQGELYRALMVIVLTALYSAKDVYKTFNASHSMKPARWCELHQMSKGERAKESDAAEYTALNKAMRAYAVTFASRLNQYGTIDPSIMKAATAKSSHGNAGKKRAPQTPAAPNAKGTNSPKGDTKPGKVKGASLADNVLANCKLINELYQECEAPSIEFRDVHAAIMHMIETGSVEE